MKSSPNLLIVADSERCADMLYAVGMFVPDPFIYLRARDVNYIVMSDLELDRARREAAHCQVLSFAELAVKAKKRSQSLPPLVGVLDELLRSLRIRAVLVPHDFPHGMACHLVRKGYRVSVNSGSVFPEREIKLPREIRRIKRALEIAEAGMQAGMDTLKRARINQKGQLTHSGGLLTSQKLRGIIDATVARLGGVATNTIVAGGAQGCDPHERGSGPLKAHTPIIMDIFPRDQASGYFGDITRTFVKGKASSAIQRQYQAVYEAQSIAFDMMRPGVSGRMVHQAVQDYFDSHGFPTGPRNGRMAGFFHGTGHGLGLEIHELPRTGPTASSQLRKGHVMTVEPGLYYPRVGGIRLEDVVLVRAGKPRLLTHFPKVLEI